MGLRLIMATPIATHCNQADWSGGRPAQVFQETVLSQGVAGFVRAHIRVGYQGWVFKPHSLGCTASRRFESARTLHTWLQIRTTGCTRKSEFRTFPGSLGCSSLPHIGTLYLLARPSPPLAKPSLLPPQPNIILAFLRACKPGCFTGCRIPFHMISDHVVKALHIIVCSLLVRRTGKRMQDVHLLCVSSLPLFFSWPSRLCH